MIDGFDQLTMNWRSALIGMIAISSIICVVYLLARDCERAASLWLAAFVGAVFVSAIPSMIGFANAYDIWPGLTFLPTQMTLLFGPLLYMHAHVIMLEKPLGWRKWLLLPGVLYWLYQCWAFLFLGDYKAKWVFNDGYHYPYVLPVIFFVGLGLVIWAFVAIWRMRARYVAWLENTRSDDDQFTPKWLSHFIVIGVLMITVWTSENVMERLFQLSYIARYWPDFFLFLLVYFLSLEAVIQIDRRFPKMPEDVGQQFIDQEVIERDWVAEGLALQREVLQNQWYLESSLSLQTLSRRFGSNQTYVSRALNKGLGVSFSDFINALRVDHAKLLISDNAASILDVAYESGFGSKASFNRAFKAHSGISPTEFRRLWTSQDA